MEKIVNKLYDIIFPMVGKHTTYPLGISILHIDHIFKERVGM